MPKSAKECIDWAAGNMSTLDGLDLALLRELQRDGRVTNLELARRVGLSPAACLERVKRLREKGIIRRYIAEIDPSAVDLSMLVFVEVRLHSNHETDLAKFRDMVRDAPEILECHLIAGQFDYLIRVRVKDINAYSVFLREKLSLLTAVCETRTCAVLEELKSTAALPI